MKVQEIYDYINGIAPFDTQMSFDNAGLLVGDGQCTFSKALITLDITHGAIAEAKKQGCTLIISHHPVIFHAVKSVPTSSPVYGLIANGMTAVCAHTNLDVAKGGVTDTLAKTIGLDTDACEQVNPEFRLGLLKEPMTAHAFAEKVSAILGGAVSFTCPDVTVTKAAVCGGAGSDYMFEAAAAGAQMLVTGEARHHEYLAARDMHFSLLTAGHHETEVLIVPVLRNMLAEQFPDAEFIAFEQDSPVKTVM